MYATHNDYFLRKIILFQSDLQEDFSWNLLSVQLLGKFLGLVWYMPYYTTQRIPPTVLTTLRETRTEVGGEWCDSGVTVV